MLCSQEGRRAHLFVLLLLALASAVLAPGVLLVFGAALAAVLPVAPPRIALLLTIAVRGPGSGADAGELLPWKITHPSHRDGIFWRC